MLAGELYFAFDPELVRDRTKAKQRCFELNQTAPLDIEKKKELTKLILGVDDAYLETPFFCDYGYNIKVGKNFYANHNCTILDGNAITIGDNCLIAPNVCISAATHPLDATSRSRGDEYTRPITIGNNCWLGASSTICPSVSIGNNVVVGAGAVVTRDMPDNVVCAGVPAKIIRQLGENGTHNSQS